MAARFYTVEFDNVVVSVAQDLFSIAPADDKPVLIVGVFLGQSSDVGDAAEEILRWRIIRGHATVGSGGTVATPRPIDRSGSAAAFTARVNDTTIASAGSPVNLHSDVFNVRAGTGLWFPPECWHETSQADGLVVVRLVAAPSDALTMTGTLYVAELG